MTHICIGKLTIVASVNVLLPDRRQAISWTNAGILLSWPLGTNFSGRLSKIHIISFKKMHLKLSSVKCLPSCLGLNVLISIENSNIFCVLSKQFNSKWWDTVCSGIDFDRVLICVICLDGVHYIIISWGQTSQADYRKISHIRRTQNQNINDYRLIMQLPLPNPLKPGVQSRMKM